MACPPEQQMARLAASRGMPRPRWNAAVPPRCRRPRWWRQADRVIDTAGTLADTRHQVLAAWLTWACPLPMPTIRPAAAGDARRHCRGTERRDPRGRPDRIGPQLTTEERKSLPGHALCHVGACSVVQLGSVMVGFPGPGPLCRLYARAWTMLRTGHLCAGAGARQGAGPALAERTFAMPRRRLSQVRDHRAGR